MNPALPTQHEKLCCSKKGKGETGICAVQGEQAYDSNLCNESVNLYSHDEVCSEVLHLRNVISSVSPLLVVL